ncbi:nucleolar protein 12 isoform X2 [Mirounga angustirostris]
MLAEREEALEEADELDRLVTAKTESVQYDHPNHTVTVTTISNLDFSGARLLGLSPPEDLRSHGITARAQSQKDQEETSPTGPRLHQEAPECHSYEQDPAPPADGQSPAQRRVSPENQAMPSLGSKGLCCLHLAGPVTQPRGGDSAAHGGEASSSGPELGPWQGQAAERWLPPGGAFRAEPGASSQMSPPLSLHQISETECTCGLFVPDPDAACQGQASEVVETIRRVGPSSPSSSFPCGDETGSVRSGPPNPGCRPA